MKEQTGLDLVAIAREARLRNLDRQRAALIAEIGSMYADLDLAKLEQARLQKGLGKARDRVGVLEAKLVRIEEGSWQDMPEPQKDKVQTKGD